ncbi:ATP-binding protein [Vibrio fluvialis]
MSFNNYFKVWMIVLVSLYSSFAQSEIVLSEDEREWVQMHPLIHYAYPESWPVDYHADGQHVGLSKDYMDIISEVTGLEFIGQPFTTLDAPNLDLIVAVPLSFAEHQKDWSLTNPYHSVSALVIADAHAATVYALSQLRGRSVGILKDSFFYDWLSANEPNITLIPYASGLDALTALNKGEVYAAIGTELTMRPLMQRYFPTTLAIAGSLPEMSTGISMAVKGSEPYLFSIINKALSSLTARQTDKIFADWVESLDLGEPPLATILFYYRNEAIVFGLLIGILILALHQARKAKLKAEMSKQDKARFLAVMSHEIRTPLNAVMASLELLHSPGADKFELKYLNMARNSARNLMELLNDILDFSRLESGKMSLHPVPTDVRKLLESVYASHLPSALEKGISLKLNVSNTANELFVLVDPQRLRQILHNLVSNAIKFSSSGEVKITEEHRNIDEQVIQLVLHVSDQGPGIEDHAQQKLFQAWQQANRHEAQKNGGSGLGLYISYQFAQLMQGELSLESELGKGTTVTLEVPLTLTNDQLVETSEQPAMPYSFSKDTCVLVVEDHELNRRLVRDLLERLGCDVDSVSNGEDAIKRVEEENYYSMILLDCHLPGVSGYEVSKHIRDIETVRQCERTPIVAISALSEVEHIAQCHESGMDDVMFKPIRSRELSGMLAKWCVSHELAEDLPSPLVALSGNEHYSADLKALELAFENQDSRHQLYYIHRLHGTALITKHDEFANLARELESKLRSGASISVAEGMDWCGRLSELVLQEIKCPEH